MSVKKHDELAKIEKLIRSCEKCPLAKTRTHAVPGIGNFEADIVFIGEGPGAKEDASGEPFVGAAGKFLDEMLASIKMKREDVFIN
jgi:uracil-DNA glycosylase family 4